MDTSIITTFRFRPWHKNIGVENYTEMLGFSKSEIHLRGATIIKRTYRPGSTSCNIFKVAASGSNPSIRNFARQRCRKDSIRLGTKSCESHQCVCGATVESNGHHGFSCIKMLGKYGRHAKIPLNSISLLNIFVVVFPP